MLQKMMKKMPSPSPTPTSPQKGGGVKQQRGTLQVLVTLTKCHEANSSEAFKDCQVVFHMCI